MSYLSWMILISVVMAVATAGLAMWLGRRLGVVVLGVALGAIAGIYGGFALADGRGPAIAIQVTAMFAFIALGVAGIARSPRILAAGYLLHAAWDGAHHLGWIPTTVLDWYPAACLFYDGIIGAFLLWWPRGNDSQP